MGQFTPAPPLRIGVGGDYPNGIDGQLSARGYPWERIFAWELSQPECLRKYDVIFLSCVPEAQSGIDEALTEWLKGGGRAYVETWTAQSRFPLRSLVRIDNGAPSKGDVDVTLAAHPLAAGLGPVGPFDMHHLQGVRVTAVQNDGAAAVAHYTTDGGTKPIEKAPAILSLRVGEGELLYSGAPVSFARFHRGRSSEALLVAIIDYLLPAGSAHRLLYTEPANTAPPGSGPRLELETVVEDGDEAPPAEPPSVPEPPPDPGTLPDGFELLDCVAEDRYNLLCTASTATEGGGEPTIILLDGLFTNASTARRPCLWLSLTAGSVELRQGGEPRGKSRSVADWEIPAEGAELRVQRRPGELRVLLGGVERLCLKARLPRGGAVAIRPGSMALAEAVCQPVGPAEFTDDFMREPESPTPWTPVSGDWTNIGIGNEEYSINGFFYLGKSAETAFATTGDWYWEDYTYSASVRPNTEGTSVGICSLVQENGDYIGLIADAATGEAPKMRLVHRFGGRESVLAECDGGVHHGQWYRLGVRLREGSVEGLIDGEPVLTAQNPEVRGGGIGVLARGGSARFDDVIVQPSERPIEAPRHEGSSIADPPPTLGPHDWLTWANPAGAWIGTAERPSLLWHQGYFPGDVDVALASQPVERAASRRLILAPSPAASEDEWVSVELLLEPGSEGAELTLTRPGGKAATKRVTLGEDALLRIRRSVGKLTVLWGAKPVFRIGGADEHRYMGLEVFGPPLRAQDLTVRGPGVHDYIFGVAPTEWWIGSGEWEVSARWACDNRWSWLAGWGSGDAAIWNKQRFEGDVVLDFWVGVKMDAPGGSEIDRCRDYNAVLCGDRQDPRSGYSFILGGDGGVKTQLLRNGEVVAESAEVRVPDGYNVHHRWFHVRAQKIGNVVSYDFEGRPVFRYEDPEPLPGGYVGLWTRNSGILIPRATVWGDEG